MSYRLKFDPDKCVGCYACHIACLDAHQRGGKAENFAGRLRHSNDADNGKGGVGHV